MTSGSAWHCAPHRGQPSLGPSVPRARLATARPRRRGSHLTQVAGDLAHHQPVGEQRDQRMVFLGQFRARKEDRAEQVKQKPGDGIGGANWPTSVPCVEAAQILVFQGAMACDRVFGTHPRELLPAHGSASASPAGTARRGRATPPRARGFRDTSRGARAGAVPGQPAEQ